MSAQATKRVGRKKVERRLQTRRENNHYHHQPHKKRSVEELVDVLTMILVRWRFCQLLQYMEYVVSLLNQRDGPGVCFEETLFSDYTEIECTRDQSISFRCYCNEVYRGASSRPQVVEQEENARKEHYVMMMRSCILIAFVHDTRVRRFIMAPHTIHYNTMQCRPPTRTKANLFEARVRVYVDDFLRRVIGMREMCFYCVEVWVEDFMLRRIGEEVDESPYHYNCVGRGERNIPHSVHPQILSKAQHIGYDPSLQSELYYGNGADGGDDDLGF